MICNCNNNKESGDGAQAVARLVYGNVLRLGIPLTLRTITLVDGMVEKEDTPFVPSADYPVTVVFGKSATKIEISAVMRDGNVAFVEDKGNIPVGTYSITVFAKDDKGNPYRFKQEAVLRVYDTTKDAGIEPTIEYEATTWYLDAAIYLALKGEDGVGIEDITTESSTEIGGLNTITITLTDGTTRTFTVMNGSGSVDDELDPNSGHPVANRIVTARFNEISSKLAGLFGDVDYDTQSKAIRFWDKDKANVLASLDARPFIKDGMVNSVYISNNTLVITFNTDSGREAIGVPLSAVFNPNNYYTKTQIDNKLSNLVSSTVTTGGLYVGNISVTPDVKDGIHCLRLQWYYNNIGHVTYIPIEGNENYIATIENVRSVIQGVFGKADYDATAHRINFYAATDTSQSKVLGYIDTTPFEGGSGGSGYSVTYDNGNVIFSGSNQPTYDNGNIIF